MFFHVYKLMFFDWFYVFFQVFAVGFLNILNGVSCWHCLIVILFYMFYLGLIVVMVVLWWYFLSNEHVCFLFAVFLCWTCVCYLSFFVLGHVSFVWLICWLFLGPAYVTWAFCTWACQLCVYLCILDLAFDSLSEGTVLCLFECVSLIFFTCDNWFTWEMFLLLVWCFCV